MRGGDFEYPIEGAECGDLDIDCHNRKVLRCHIMVSRVYLEPKP